VREHYTSNTVSASKWCRVCRKHTQHRVDSHVVTRVCLECQEKDEAQRASRALQPAESPAAVQEEMFA
jgi:hypothetical protein